MSVVRDGIELLHRDGLSAFLRGISRHVHWKLFLWWTSVRVTVALVRGELVLRPGDSTATFVAESRRSLTQTVRRFERESDRLCRIVDELDESDVFYDVGANTGLYTCFAANHCAEVVAFEPYPPNVSELGRNARRNGDNVAVHEVALSNERGSVSFSVPREYPGQGKGSIGTEQPDVTVPTVDGDTLVKEGLIPPPDVVKIDVEGAEPLVVDGLKQTLSDERCRLVHCEVHRPKASRESTQTHGVSESEMVARFEELGFSVEIIDDIGKEFVIEARRQD